MCRPFKPEELPPGSEVPEGVKAAQSEFWLCARCGKVFWQGGQYGVAMSKLSTRLNELLQPPMKGHSSSPLRNL